jgi:leader peptidase (prepilin peptidase)/N-methyltransferase
MLGLIAGSFLATLVVRWGRGDSVTHGRSCCDGCGVSIPSWALVPLLSYAALRGQCGACGAAIDRRHIAMEALCAAIGGVELAVRPDLGGLAGALFGWMLATLALIDAEHFWLPDALTLPLAGIGLGVGALGIEPALPDRVIGAAGGYLSFALIAWAYQRLRGRVGLGQGDAKLLGAIGAWLGWAVLPWVVLGAALAGICWVVLGAARGRTVMLGDRLPLGTLLVMVALPVWLAMAILA